MLGPGSASALGEVGVSAVVSEGLQPALNRSSKSRSAGRRMFLPCLPDAWVKARKWSEPASILADEISVCDYISA